MAEQAGPQGGDSPDLAWRPVLVPFSVVRSMGVSPAEISANVRRLEEFWGQPGRALAWPGRTAPLEGDCHAQLCLPSSHALSRFGLATPSIIREETGTGRASGALSRSLAQAEPP